MKKALKIIGIVLAVVLLGAADAWFGFLRPEPPPISPEDRMAIDLMPLPSSLELKGEKLYLSSAPKVSFEGVSTDRLEKASGRFAERLSNCIENGIEGSAKTEISDAGAFQLRIRCDSVSSRFPKLEEDESYSLKIWGSQVNLSARGERGVLHGLETLFQLLEKDGQGCIF